MSELQQTGPGGASSEASSGSASSGNQPKWAYSNYFDKVKPPVRSNETPTPLFDIDAIASSIKVEDEDDLDGNGNPLVITIKS